MDQALQYVDVNHAQSVELQEFPPRSLLVVCEAVLQDTPVAVPYTLLSLIVEKVALKPIPFAESLTFNPDIAGAHRCQQVRCSPFSAGKCECL